MFAPQLFPAAVVPKVASRAIAIAFRGRQDFSRFLLGRHLPTRLSQPRNNPPGTNAFDGPNTESHVLPAAECGDILRSKLEPLTVLTLRFETLVPIRFYPGRITCANRVNGTGFIR